MYKHFSLFGFIFLFVTYFSLLAQTPEMTADAAKLYNEGNKLVKSGQYQGALEKYDGALDIQKHPNIYYQKSVALKKLRNYTDAESALLAAVKIDSNFVTAYSGLGTTYYSLRRYNDAITNFQKYISLSDNEAQNDKIRKFIGLAFTSLGQNAKSDGKYDVAVAHLNEAVKNYNYDAAYLYLAEIHVETGNYDLALEAADKAINFRTSKSKISRGAPYYYKGLAFKGKSDTEKARENFLIAVKDSQYKGPSQYELDFMK
ncbi:tetratricopeptide repeat protein [Bacteroidota bacterium]